MPMISKLQSVVRLTSTSQVTWVWLRALSTPTCMRLDLRISLLVHSPRTRVPTSTKAAEPLSMSKVGNLSPLVATLVLFNWWTKQMSSVRLRARSSTDQYFPVSFQSPSVLPSVSTYWAWSMKIAPAPASCALPISSSMERCPYGGVTTLYAPDSAAIISVSTRSCCSSRVKFLLMYLCHGRPAIMHIRRISVSSAGSSREYNQGYLPRRMFSYAALTTNQLLYDLGAAAMVVMP